MKVSSQVSMKYKMGLKDANIDHLLTFCRYFLRFWTIISGTIFKNCTIRIKIVKKERKLSDELTFELRDEMKWAA